MFVIIFQDFLMFQQIFLSPQVKRIMIISTKHVIYELPHELPNDLRIWILGKNKILRRSRIFTQLQPSAQSSSQNETFVNANKKLLKYLNKIFLVLRYFKLTLKFASMFFGQDCLWKKCFASNSPQVPTNLIPFRILITLRPLTQF